jgi:hypothetical protein
MNAPNTGGAAWVVLERGIVERAPVRLRYHGQERLVCPHAMGWKHGRAKVFALQVAANNDGSLPRGPHRSWRSLFVDEVEDATIAEGDWHSTPGYVCASRFNGIDVIEVAVSSLGPLPA